MSSLSKPAIWAAVHAERHRLVGDLTGLAPEKFAEPSLCAGWDVHDVLAHLVDSAGTTRLGFVGQMIRARGDFDRANAHGVERERREDPADTLAAFKGFANATHTRPAGSRRGWWRRTCMARTSAARSA
ncbi:maleylpyruvate isomerase family mycothiol-dependent enzyme [Microlunatus sp. Y2014]|uniref:maleylpyruvate isomerase family mycothiol-dependent enzyme n=1 Tax=Microlunatus sp. Y2014 TaxID=3418488 RepID=UPI003DA78294